MIETVQYNTMSTIQVSPSLDSLSHTIDSPHLNTSSTPSKSKHSNKSVKYSYISANQQENLNPNYSRNNAPQSSKNSRSNSIIETNTSNLSNGLTQRHNAVQSSASHQLLDNTIQFTPAEIKLQRARNLAFTRRESNKTKLLRDAALANEQSKSNNILYIISFIWGVVILIMLYVVLTAIYNGHTASKIGFTPIDSKSFGSYKQRYANAGYERPSGYTQ